MEYVPVAALLILVLLIIVGMVLCKKYDYSNGIPTFFIEPDEFVIAKIVIRSNPFFEEFLYGYISKCDYLSYLDGTLCGGVIIRHPYEAGKETIIASRKIQYIEIGWYKDFREN